MEQRTQDAIDRYVTKRLPPGGFLSAVLANDLQGAIARADNDSLRDLKEIVQYVYNKIPGNCWGNRATVQGWLEGGDE